MSIHILSRNYPGWSLSDIKSLTLRERRNWMEVIRWEMKVREHGYLLR